MNGECIANKHIEALVPATCVPAVACNQHQNAWITYGCMKVIFHSTQVCCRANHLMKTKPVNDQCNAIESCALIFLQGDSLFYWSLKFPLE